MSTRRIAVAALLAILAALAWSARPQPLGAAERVDRITAELRCPVCQGLAVKDSPSETAREMRDLVTARVAQGVSDEEIRAEFRASYGDWVFLDPPLGGPSGLIWLVPLAAVALGAALAWRRLGPQAAEGPPPTPEELARLRAVAAEEP